MVHDHHRPGPNNVRDQCVFKDESLEFDEVVNAPMIVTVITQLGTLYDSSQYYFTVRQTAKRRGENKTVPGRNKQVTISQTGVGKSQCLEREFTDRKFSATVTNSVIKYFPFHYNFCYFDDNGMSTIRLVLFAMFPSRSEFHSGVRVFVRVDKIVGHLIDDVGVHLTLSTAIDWPRKTWSISMLHVEILNERKGFVTATQMFHTCYDEKFEMIHHQLACTIKVSLPWVMGTIAETTSFARDITQKTGYHVLALTVVEEQTYHFAVVDLLTELGEFITNLINNLSPYIDIPNPVKTTDGIAILLLQIMGDNTKNVKATLVDTKRGKCVCLVMKPDIYVDAPTYDDPERLKFRIAEPKHDIAVLLHSERSPNSFIIKIRNPFDLDKPEWNRMLRLLNSWKGVLGELVCYAILYPPKTGIKDDNWTLDGVAGFRSAVLGTLFCTTLVATQKKLPQISTPNNLRLASVTDHLFLSVAYETEKAKIILLVDERVLDCEVVDYESFFKAAVFACWTRITWFNSNPLQPTMTKLWSNRADYIYSVITRNVPQIEQMFVRNGRMNNYGQMNNVTTVSTALLKRTFDVQLVTRRPAVQPRFAFEYFTDFVWKTNDNNHLQIELTNLEHKNIILHGLWLQAVLILAQIEKHTDISTSLAPILRYPQAPKTTNEAMQARREVLLLVRDDPFQTRDPCTLLDPSLDAERSFMPHDCRNLGPVPVSQDTYKLYLVHLNVWVTPHKFEHFIINRNLTPDKCSTTVINTLSSMCYVVLRQVRNSRECRALDWSAVLDAPYNAKNRTFKSSEVQLVLPPNGYFRRHRWFHEISCTFVGSMRGGDFVLRKLLTSVTVDTTDEALLIPLYCQYDAQTFKILNKHVDFMAFQLLDQLNGVCRNCVEGHMDQERLEFRLECEYFLVREVLPRVMEINKKLNEGSEECAFNVRFFHEYKNT
ncbi:hypothetical protein CLF_109041, partial [Clonorchis sinensis]